MHLRDGLEIEEGDERGYEYEVASQSQSQGKNPQSIPSRFISPKAKFRIASALRTEGTPPWQVLILSNVRTRHLLRPSSTSVNTYNVTSFVRGKLTSGGSGQHLGASRAQLGGSCVSAMDSVGLR